MLKNKTYIIAEAGVNHNGSIAMAKKLVDAAARAGADAVKFQTFRAAELVCASSPKADYQKENTNAGETQFDMLRKLELDEAAHKKIADHCRTRNIQFLSTPFNEEGVDLLVRRIKVPLLKLPSGEITNGPLLLKAARTRKPVILSTGMCTLAEIREALGVLAFGYVEKFEKPSLAAFRAAYLSKAGQNALKKKVVLLHCTTQYPAPCREVNLRAMETMHASFGLPVGLSDHTRGIAAAIAAVALGASVIEKHFTLDRNLPGPDHKASLVPDELGLMIRSIREVEQALGIPRKGPTPSEKKNLRIARRSLVALKAIACGEVFSSENLGCKRPGTGMTPMRYWKNLGRRATKNYAKDELIRS